MTIATTTATTGWLQGNGATTVWNFSFLIPYLSDGITPAISVLYRDASGTITTLSPANYTVAGIGNPAGGSVTYSPAIATGTFLEINRTVPYTQPDAFPNQGFLPESVEEALDNLELQIQQIYGIATTTIFTNVTTIYSGGAGAMIYSSLYATLALADAAAVASGGQLVIDKNWTLATNTTLSAKSVRFSGGVITRGTYTLTFGGSVVIDATQVAFDRTGTGLVTFTGDEGLISIVWFGGIGDGVTDNAVPLQQAARSATTGIGGTVYIPVGTYNVSAGLPLYANLNIQGDSDLYSQIHYTGSGTLFTLGGRNDFMNFYLSGTSKTGVGIDVGGTDFAGDITLKQVRITGFATGIKMSGALWFYSLNHVISENLVGVDFHAADANHYSTTVVFQNGQINLNDRQGIACSYTPVRNQNISIINGSVEENCTSAPASYGQIELNVMSHVTLDNVYMSYSLPGTPPDAIRLNDMAHFDCKVFCDTSNIGINVGNNSLTNARVCHSRFIGTVTHDIVATGGALVTGLVLENNEYSSTNNISAASYLEIVNKTIRINGDQIITVRDTGWAAMTGTPDKSTAFATSTVTLAQLAGRVMSLQAALTTHGLLGP